MRRDKGQRAIAVGAKARGVYETTQQQESMAYSSLSVDVLPSALRMVTMLLLSANAESTAVNRRQGTPVPGRFLLDCTIGDSFSVVAPSVPDMEGCYIWDNDYMNPPEGFYGYFHEEFGPTRPRYVAGGPSIGWELFRSEGASCRSALNTSAPSYPVEATWLCDPEEFGIAGADGGSDGFLELDPSAFSMICNSTCPSAQVGLDDDDTTTAEDVLDDDALAGTVDDDDLDPGIPRSFTTAPTSAPTAAPSAPPITVAPSPPAAAEDTPRSSPLTTSGPSASPSASPTTVDGGRDGAEGEGGDAVSRTATLSSGHTTAAAGAFAAILAMVLVSQ